MNTQNEHEDDLLMTPGERLRKTCTACRLGTSRLGMRRCVTEDQKKTAADSLNADSEGLSASKKLFKSRNKHVAKVTAILSKIKQEWLRRTHPYVDDGVRLIKNEQINLFNDFVNTARIDLRKAEEALQEHRDEVLAEAKKMLGDLYNAADYPASFVGQFAVEVDYPNVEPPSYLEAINPDLYKQQCERVQARFSAAVEMAEELYVVALNKLVTNLAERLTPDDKGQKKTFQAGSVDNIHEFIRSFRQMYVGTNKELTALVDRAQEILTTNASQDPNAPQRVPIGSTEIRNVDWLRNNVRDGMTKLAETLQSMVTSLPRRQLSGVSAEKLAEVEL